MKDFTFKRWIIITIIIVVILGSFPAGTNAQWWVTCSNFGVTSAGPNWFQTLFNIPTWIYTGLGGPFWASTNIAFPETSILAGQTNGAVWPKAMITPPFYGSYPFALKIMLPQLPLFYGDASFTLGWINTSNPGTYGIGTMWPAAMPMLTPIFGPGTFGYTPLAEILPSLGTVSSVVPGWPTTFFLPDIEPTVNGSAWPAAITYIF